MNQAFARLSDEDRRLAVANAALALGIEAVILEKDFWVSWLLGLLFAHPVLAPHLVFKGGTSLSKVFGVIDRFSEDIDLCLMPECAGADAKGFDALASRVKRDAAVLEMQRMCAEKTREELMPALEHAIAQRLGDARGGTWLHYELDADAKSPIVYFPAQRQAALAQDYAEMRSMFMSEPPLFAELLERLARAEATLNKV